MAAAEAQTLDVTRDVAMLSWYFLISGAFFTGVFLLLVWRTVPAAATWLLAGVAARIGVCALRTVRASRDSASRPELLSEASLPTMTLMLSLYPAFVLLSFTKIDLRNYDPRLVGGLVLGLYFVVAASLAWRGWGRVNAAAAALRAFIACGRAPHSSRNARIGSANAARVGGNHAAISDVLSNTAAAATWVIGSGGLSSGKPG